MRSAVALSVVALQVAMSPAASNVASLGPATGPEPTVM